MKYSRTHPSKILINLRVTFIVFYSNGQIDKLRNNVVLKKVYARGGDLNGKLYSSIPR